MHAVHNMSVRDKLYELDLLRVMRRKSFVDQQTLQLPSVYVLGLLILCGIMVNGPFSLITTAVSANLGQSALGNMKALATVTAIIDGTGSIGRSIVCFNAIGWC